MLDHDDTIRECVRGPRCPDAHTAPDGSRRGAPITSLPFCDRCVLGVRAALGALPGLYDDLAGLLGVIGQGSGDRVATSKVAPPIPFRADVDALMEHMFAVVAGWDQRVRAANGMPPGPVRVAWSRRSEWMRVTAHRLAELTPILLGLPLERTERRGAEGRVEVYELGGADAGLEVLELESRARSKAGLSRPTVVLQGVDCPRCGGWLSKQVGDAGLVVCCLVCGETVTDEDYERWVAYRAGQAREAAS